MRQGGGKILIGFFVLSGFFYCSISIRLALHALDVQATSTTMVVINEVAWMGNISNENQEWIELKNNSLEAVDLTDWQLKAADGTPKVLLKGIIEPDGYFLLERTSELSVPNVTSSQIYSGALGNGGEQLELYDASSTLIDQIVSSSSWPSGDNSTKQTMERDSDGNWHTSAIPGGTPKLPNSLSTSSAVEIVPETNAASTTTTSTIQSVLSETSTPSISYAANQAAELEIEIMEILPNPKGNDTAGEFVELFNAGTSAVDLTGWKLVIGDRQYVVVPTSSRSNNISPNGHLALWRAETKLVLPNDQGQVLLYSPEKTAPRQAVSYEKAPEGKSYAKNDLSEWRWSEQPTPGDANIIKADNQAPEVDWSVKSRIEAGENVLFDSSDTTDPEDDKLDFLWQFGDGASSSEPSPMHAFQNHGRFKVELMVSDGGAKAVKTRTLIVSAPKPTSSVVLNPAVAGNIKSIIINEFLPNPAGEDVDGEWVELYNSASNEIDMLGWQLDDAVGGSRPYQFSDSVIIKPLSFYVVNREDSNMALNNGSDEVRLFDSQGRLADTVSYGSAKEGLSYAKSGRGSWQWSAPTPGKANQIVQLATQPKTAAKKTKAAAANKARASAKKAAATKTGNWLTITGTVSALPGQIAKQIFYVVGSDCWQVYNYRRDFPKLALGSRIQAYGQVENIKGEKRLKTSKLADIKLLGAGQPPVPDELQCRQVGPMQLSRLVKVSGELTKKTSALWYVDDGSGEIAVYVSKAIAGSFSKIEEGDKLSVAGLVAPATAGVRIVPRSIADIIPVKAAQAESYADVPETIPARNSAIELRQYLEFIALGVVLTGLGWWIRKRYSM